MQRIDLIDILQETVSQEYGDLVTRRTGQAVRFGVEQALATGGGDKVAAIDFTGVRCLDLSCADEIVAKLLLSGSRGHCFLLRGVSESHRDAIDPVLERHGLAVAAEDRAGRMDVLGPVSEPIRQVFLLLVEHGTADVLDVSERLEVAPTTAKEMFDELLERRLALADAAGNLAISIA